MFGVDQRHDGIQHEILGNVFVHKKGLGHRRGVCQPCGLNYQMSLTCILLRGFIRLRYAATTSHITDPSGNFDAVPAKVALSAAAVTVTDNYQRCHENTEQLIPLQSWIRQVSRG